MIHERSSYVRLGNTFSRPNELITFSTGTPYPYLATASSLIALKNKKRTLFDKDGGVGDAESRHARPDSK